MAANQKSKISSALVTLPIDVLLEIFVRLPTESLHRIQCLLNDNFPELVKSLKSSAFQHRHAFNLLNNPTNEVLFLPSQKSVYIIHRVYPHPSTVLLPRPGPSITHTYNLKSIFKEIFTKNRKARLYYYRVIGASNGLICLSLLFYRLLKSSPGGSGHRSCKVFSNLILWNPYTGEHNLLPNHNKNDISIYGSTVCGFGYDFANKTYKLVIVENSIIQLYDLSTNVWKVVVTVHIDHHKFRYMSEHRGTTGKYLNGVLHWIVSNTDIISFDLSTELNNRLSSPLSCYNIKNPLNLGVLKGCLSVSYDEGGDKVSIWVMKEYGIQESWTNISTISLEPIIRSAYYNYCVFRSPLRISQGDNMLFLDVDRLAYGNLEDGKLSYVEGLKFRDCSQAIIHVDTLVSPKPSLIV